MKTHLERFIRFLAAEKGLSAAYQLSVRQTLEEFARFLGTEDADLSRVDIGTLTEFLRHLQARGMARSSMRVEMVHLRIFFRWLAGMGMLEKDPSAFLEMPRQGLSLPHVLDQQTVSTLLESVDVQDIPLGCRDRALLEMIYACGMRVSEVISCKLESLDMNDAFVRVLGKGEKTRLVPVGRSALEALRTYLEKGRPRLVKPGTKSHIFLDGARTAADQGTGTPDSPGTRQGRGNRTACLPAYPPAFLRHASAGERRRPPHHSGNAGACRYFHHPDLYASGTAAAECHSSPLPSQGIKLFSSMCLLRAYIF